jgi:hypothetical protein
VPEPGALLAAAELGPAPDHALISQLAMNEPRILEATGIGMLSRRATEQAAAPPCRHADRPGLSSRASTLTGLRQQISMRADRTEAATRQRRVTADSAPLPGRAIPHDALHDAH